MPVVQMSIYPGAKAEPLPFAASRQAERQNRRTRLIRERVVQLFDELRGPVFQHLLYLGLVPEEADEVVQETFLRLFQHLLVQGGDQNLRGWVFKVAHNISHDRRKGRKYLAAVDPDQWRNATESRPDSSPSPEELLIRRERADWLRAQMASLSPQQQQCLHLRVEGFRYREIADILGISVSTVAEMLRRAIGRLSRQVCP